MSKINMEVYFNSLHNFTGEIVKEQLNRIQEINRDITIFPEEDLFYAKGMFKSEVTDKFYFFNEDRMRVITINIGEDKFIESAVLTDYSYSDFDFASLNLNREFGVNLLLRYKSGEEFQFNNKSDADEKWIDAHGKQIKAIYSLLNK